jgi:hypothetical protein
MKNTGMIDKYTRYTVLLGLCCAFNLSGCYAAADTSQNNSSDKTVYRVKNSEQNSSTVDVTTTKKERENYDLVELSKLPQGVSLVGSDPKEIAIAVFSPPQEEPQEGNFQRDVNVLTVTSAFVTVIISETGLLDDSVNGIRYRADFESSEVDSKSWKMVWAGKQYKCQSGRGSQDWSKKLCS